MKKVIEGILFCNDCRDYRKHLHERLFPKEGEKAARERQWQSGAACVLPVEAARWYFAAVLRSG